MRTAQPAHSPRADGVVMTTTPLTTPAGTARVVVERGSLGDVNAAARLVQPPAGVVADAGESEGLLRLGLAHLSLTSGGLWVLRARHGRGPLTSAAALLPPGGHPDVSAMAWMAHVQLGLDPLPGGEAREAQTAWVLLPPRQLAGAAALVGAALAAVGSARRVVSPVPSHPAVAALLRERGFAPDAVPGLLRLNG